MFDKREKASISMNGSDEIVAVNLHQYHQVSI